VRIGSNPPHNISRVTVERAIESEGVQLWRTAPSAKE
jgi:hypothetical protein